MRRKKVSIQGIAASFHDVAAQKFFGRNIDIIEANSFRSSCEKMVNGEADYCVMAIENSTAGTILTNYQFITDYRLRVIGEVYLQIELHLMGLNGAKIDDIEFIHSHPMAIRQCDEFLLRYPDKKVLALNDTAECARNVRDKKLNNTAVIAGDAAAEKYGMTIMHSNIETHKRNYTRFLILSDKNIKIKGANKASISFQLDNSPRNLKKVVDILGDYWINLTKIQSVPIVGRPNEYTFLVDLEWSKYEDYETAITKVLKKTFNLSILGEYRKGKFVTAKL
ncbi:MAG: prephenate dehydratase [Chitinophagaceae bacterium]|nr:prephenate dehydratase [Chitinophagaceae bacterium]